MTGGTAVFSPDGSYRYRLTRSWSPGPRVCFVMLNPSTADAQRDDPTIRRCIGFARRWGYAGIVVVNLFAYRSTRPEELRRVADPVGPLNDAHIRRAHAMSSLTVVAWGAEEIAAGRALEITQVLSRGIRCLGTTVTGAPRHPLYLRGSLRPKRWMSRDRRSKDEAQASGRAVAGAV